MSKVMLVLAVVLSISGCSSRFVNSIEQVDIDLADLKSAQFIQGMDGGENIYLPANSSKAYITDLSGIVYLLDENSEGRLEIKSSSKLGRFALGVVRGKDGYLYVNASQHGLDGWLEQGGEVYKVDTELESFSKTTDSFKGINGLAMDAKGDLYFSVGDLEYFFPDGAIYKMAYDPANSRYGKPALFLDGLGSVNGMFYSELYDKLFYTETFSKVSTVDIETKQTFELFGKTKIIEGFDDLCVDSKGNVWVAEPIAGFIKKYDPKARTLTRIHVNGLGVASSCRTRIKDSEEYIFITEREAEKDNDGRGVLVVSISELLSHRVK